MKNTWKEEAKSERNLNIFPSETEAGRQETQTSVQKSFFFLRFPARTSIQSSTNGFLFAAKNHAMVREEEQFRVWKCSSFEKERNQTLIANRDTEMMMMMMMMMVVMTTSTKTTMTVDSSTYNCFGNGPVFLKNYKCSLFTHHQVKKGGYGSGVPLKRMPQEELRIHSHREALAWPSRKIL